MRIPPQSLEAEQCTLGSLILNNAAMDRFVDVIKADDFYRPDHRLVYTAMINLHRVNTPIDLVTLRDELQRMGKLKEVGGVDYLVRLGESVPSASNVSYYAKIVKGKSLLRSYISSCSNLVQLAYQPDATSEVFASHAESMLLTIAQRHNIDKPQLISQILPDVVDNIKRRTTHGADGLPTGFVDLDEITGGLHSGEMIVVAGRPSMGKSVLAFNIAENVASQNISVVVFSLEMSKLQLGERSIARHSNLGMHQMQKGYLNDDGIRTLDETAHEISQMPLLINDTPKLTPTSLRSQARALKRTHDIKLIVVDYMQLMDLPGDKKRYEKVGECSRQLKLLARELKIPVMVVCQLNREAETRENHRPRLSDLRESGNIEQDADTVMLLYRPDYYIRDETKKTGEGIIVLAKQRSGPTGEVRLDWEGNSMRFTSKE